MSPSSCARPAHGQTSRGASHAWYLFAGVAALSLLTKYVIRYRGAHVFNPSNIGLVVAFVVLGSTRAEPLDFWWGPLDGWLIAAYTVILGGGLLVTARLRLLAMAASFWVTLAAGVGVLAASGHCMTARWAFAPVCGFDFWRVIVTSPEVLIFLFFMITDPKTVPAGRFHRVLFGVLVAVASTLLMAPQTNEFGTKVALLAGLVVMCAARPLGRPLRSRPRHHLQWSCPRRADRRHGRRARRRHRRRRGPARGVVVPEAADILGRVPHDVDPATFPTITVEQDVSDWNHEIAGPGAQELVLTLAENLELEAQALLRADATILDAVDHGDRLDEMQARLDEAEATGVTVVERYQIDDVDVTLLVPFGRQDGLSLGLESSGTVTEETYDAGGQLQERTSAPFATTFVMRRATGDRWLNVAVLPLDREG